MRGALGRSIQTLQARFLLALVLIGMLPIGLLGLSVATVYHQALVDQSSRELSGLARGLASTLDIHFQRLLDDSQAIAVMPGITRMQPAEQQTLLQEFFHVYPMFSHLAVFTPNGAIAAASAPGPIEETIANRPAFQTAAQRGVQAWEIGVTSATGRRSLLIFTPIRNAERSVTGVVRTVVDLENLAAVVGRMPVGGGGQTFVLDADDSLLLHADETVINSHPDYSWIWAGSGGRAAGANTVWYSRDDEDFVASYAPVPNIGWTVIVERPEDNILEAAEQARRLARYGIILSAAIGGIAAWALARRLTRPLQGLANAARALGAGNLNAPLPTTNADLEFQTVVEAFSEMRDRLAARTHERERAEAALRFLAEASQRLAGSLDYEVTLESIAHLAVPFLADYCIVDILVEPRVIRRLAVSHANPEKAGLVRELMRFPPDLAGSAPIPTVMRTGQSRLMPVVPDCYIESIARNAEHRRVIEQLAPVSSMVVPLRARGRILGSISFESAESGRRYNASDLALAEDLAHRCALAMDNARLYQETQEAVQARDTFLSIASHELKTPVTVIKGMAQMLLHHGSRGALDQERLFRALRTLDSTSDRLTTLTNDLLDVSRIRLQKLPIRPRRMDVVTLVREVVTRHEAQLDARHQFRLRFDADPCPIMADVERLEQVLDNVIGNAVKYSPEGGPIDVVVSLEDRGVLIIVQDHGIGLPAGAESRIFEPFGRAANATARQLPGLGLGLYISNAIINQHGGRIWVDSEGENCGTTVSVWLPTTGIAPVVTYVADSLEIH